MKPLYKATIVIWSEYNPMTVELSDLAREAEQGSAYCSEMSARLIEDPSQDPDFDATEFFAEDDD